MSVKQKLACANKIISITAHRVESRAVYHGRPDGDYFNTHDNFVYNFVRITTLIEIGASLSCIWGKFQDA